MSIDENIKSILTQNKYYIVLVINRKTSLLSSNNNKSDLKLEAIEKLLSKSKDINLFNNKILYKFTIKKVSKRIKCRKNSNITLIGGPLVIIIEEITFNNMKFSNTSSSNKVFVDNKYLEKYNFIDENTIRKLAYAYENDIIEGGFTINKLSNILKKFEILILININFI